MFFNAPFFELVAIGRKQLASQERINVKDVVFLSLIA